MFEVFKKLQALSEITLGLDRIYAISKQFENKAVVTIKRPSSLC